MKFAWWYRRVEAVSAADARLPAAGNVATSAELIALRGRVAAGAWRRTEAVAAATGSHRSRQAGRGMEFAEVRPYQPGDDVRNIDWWHFARRGRPCTKVFHAERERPVLLVIDTGPSMRFGTRVAFKSVLAARAAMLLAWAAAEAGDRVGGIVCDAGGSRVVAPQRSQHGVFALIRHLTTDPGGRDGTGGTASAGGTALAASLRALRPNVRPGTLIVVFSDFHALDAEAEAELGRLGRRATLALVQIFDALEAEAPPAGVYCVTDGVSDRILDLRAAAARASYGQPFRGRSRRLAALARHVDAALIPLATDDDPMRVLYALGRMPMQSAPTGGVRAVR
jgi:uncharacterized protein (DUF58 family)